MLTTCNFESCVRSLATFFYKEMYISLKEGIKTFPLKKLQFPATRKNVYLLVSCGGFRTEIICFLVAYREVFWEELSRLIWRELLIRRPVQYISYFSTAYRRELVTVFKVSCFSFLNCFVSFLLDIIFLPALPSRTVYFLLMDLDTREKIYSPIQDLFCSHKP